MHKAILDPTAAAFLRSPWREAEVSPKPHWLVSTCTVPGEFALTMMSSTDTPGTEASTAVLIAFIISIVKLAWEVTPGGTHSKGSYCWYIKTST